MPSVMLERKTTGHYGRLVVGYTLLVLGLAALVLPGPGLLLVAAGLTVLSQQYIWARKRLAPVRNRAFALAERSVRSWLSILVTTVAALTPIALGIVWGLQPRVPGWWPLAERWWLPGGWGTASSLIGSGLIALGLLTYSYGRFRRGVRRGVRLPPPGEGSPAVKQPAGEAGDSDRKAP